MGCLAFQSRLGIICRTLASVVGPIAHLVLIIVIVIVMTASASHVVLGTRVAQLSTYASSLSETFSLLIGLGALDVRELVAPPALQQLGAERAAGTLILMVQVLFILFVLFNYFFATLISTFLRHKRSVDWAKATTVPQDLFRVVLPDAARALRRLATRGAGAASECRKGDPGTDGATAGQGETPTNRQLLKQLAKGGVDERLFAAQLAKTWNGRVRAARVAGGRLLVDKATMRRLMLATAGATDRAERKLEGGTASGAPERERSAMAVLAAQRVMARVGATYGAASAEYRILAEAAEVEAARRRRAARFLSSFGAGEYEDDEGGLERQASSESFSEPRRTLSAEIQIHLSIYDALNAAVESIVRWQSGVHRWQLRTWKQMAAAYLFNQQLLAGLGVAPGPAFVERPRALQDEGLPHVPRPQSATPPQHGGGVPLPGLPPTPGGGRGEGPGSPSGSTVRPPWMRVQPPARRGSLDSGTVSPSQLSMTEGVTRSRLSGSVGGAPHHQQLHLQKQQSLQHQQPLDGLSRLHAVTGPGDAAPSVNRAESARLSEGVLQEGGRWASPSFSRIGSQSQALRRNAALDGGAGGAAGAVGGSLAGQFVEEEVGDVEVEDRILAAGGSVDSATGGTGVETPASGGGSSVTSPGLQTRQRRASSGWIPDVVVGQEPLPRVNVQQAAAAAQPRPPAVTVAPLSPGLAKHHLFRGHSYAGPAPPPAVRAAPSEPRPGSAKSPNGPGELPSPVPLRVASELIPRRGGPPPVAAVRASGGSVTMPVRRGGVAPMLVDIRDRLLSLVKRKGTASTPDAWGSMTAGHANRTGSHASAGGSPAWGGGAAGGGTAPGSPAPASMMYNMAFSSGRKEAGAVAPVVQQQQQQQQQQRRPSESDDEPSIHYEY